MYYLAHSPPTFICNGGDMNHKQSIGQKGEQLVVSFLIEQGFEIVACNVHSRFGELDIVAQKSKRLHIVEVKTRTSDAFGHPVETLTQRKFQKIKKTVHALQQDQKIPAKPYHIDFAAVLITEEKVTIEWFYDISSDQIGAY